MFENGADLGILNPTERAALAVIICTRNRAPLLRDCLESVTRQSIEKSAFHVVVVDDGSTDETPSVVRHFHEHLPLRVVHQQHAGLASAKNLGLFCTTAGLVLFLDDDDIAHPDLVAEHLRTHAQWPQEHYAVLGFTGLTPELARDPFVAFTTESGGFQFCYRDLVDGSVLDYTYLWGGRTSCKRPFLLNHGIFNPVFRFGCEDIELGFRLSRHHLRVVFNRAAESTMTRGFSLDEFCERLTAQGRSNAVFARLHPAAPDVQEWTEVSRAADEWPAVAPAYDEIIKTARTLDSLARRKASLCFALDDHESELLHRAYFDACRAAKMRGIVQHASSGQPPEMIEGRYPGA
jgi:GT2 family glycosyltransferase